jgi:prephenate dehydrogenase
LIHFGNPLESTKSKLETRRVRWKKVTLVGVGLLGGSLGQAVRKRHLAHSVMGFVRRKESERECRKFKAVDSAALDLHKAVSDADLIVLCTPISRMPGLVKQMLPSLKAGVVITDVGSVKGSVVRELELLASKAGAHFVGSHPMAGAEKMGVASARPDLFSGAVCIVTPTQATNRKALRKVIDLWKAVGARVMALTPEMHDEWVGRTSHLPHVVAATLTNVVLGKAGATKESALCANGFRDTTRIASGSPEMWRDIAIANRRNIARAMDQFSKELQGFKRVLLKGDEAGISKYFERAKHTRDEWVKKTRSASPE